MASNKTEKLDWWKPIKGKCDYEQYVLIMPKHQKFI